MGDSEKNVNIRQMINIANYANYLKLSTILMNYLTKGQRCLIFVGIRNLGYMVGKIYIFIYSIFFSFL